MVECFSCSIKGSGSKPSNSPRDLRNFVVLSTPIGACKYGFPSTSLKPRPNSLYIQTLTSAFTRPRISAKWAPRGITIFTSAPIPVTKRRISCRSLGMLKVPYIGPRMFTLGLEPSSRFFSGGILPLVIPNSVNIQVMALSADSHWSSSIVRGKNL